MVREDSLNLLLKTEGEGCFLITVNQPGQRHIKVSLIGLSYQEALRVYYLVLL